MKLFRNSLINKCVVKHIFQTLTATEERGHIIIYAGGRTHTRTNTKITPSHRPQTCRRHAYV